MYIHPFNGGFSGRACLKASKVPIKSLWFVGSLPSHIKSRRSSQLSWRPPTGHEVFSGTEKKNPNDGIPMEV